MRGFGNRGAAGSYLKQNYEMLAERGWIRPLEPLRQPR